jgi:hypothetical protein
MSKKKMSVKKALDIVYELALGNSLDPCDYVGDDLIFEAERQQQALSLVEKFIKKNKELLKSLPD